MLQIMNYFIYVTNFKPVNKAVRDWQSKKFISNCWCHTYMLWKWFVWFAVWHNSI